MGRHPYKQHDKFICCSCMLGKWRTVLVDSAFCPNVPGSNPEMTLIKMLLYSRWGQVGAGLFIKQSPQNYCLPFSLPAIYAHIGNCRRQIMCFAQRESKCTRGRYGAKLKKLLLKPVVPSLMKHLDQISFSCLAAWTRVRLLLQSFSPRRRTLAV